jgi:NADPH:quinone reductase
MVELDKPEPAAGEVLVKVRWSAVNPTDWKARRVGRIAGPTYEQVVPGQDGAGEIEDVGQGVDPGRIGERVWLWLAQWQHPHGTAAQWLVLPAERAVHLPDGISLEQGAGLGIPAMTAHRCLFGDGALSDSAVLVHGGAGAVGHAAIELARWAGARVATTVSSAEKADLAQAAGADLVVDYWREDVADAVRAWTPEGVARIVEVDLAGNIEADAAVLVPGGTIACYAAAAAPFLPPRTLMVLNAAIKWMLLYTMPEDAKRAAVSDISSALGDRALTALPCTRFPLERISEAHDQVERGAFGRVLVEVPHGDW